jgi:hypothetical protein
MHDAYRFLCEVSIILAKLPSIEFHETALSDSQDITVDRLLAK